MTRRSLYRTAAIALGVSAAATVAGYLAHPSVDVDGMSSAAWRVSHLLLWVGGVAGVLGVIGLYLRQRTEIRPYGTIGAALAAIALLALTGAYHFEAIVVPILVLESPTLMETFPGGDNWTAYRAAVATAGVAIGLGFLLFGATMLRGRLLPSWAVVATVVGAIGAGVQFALPGSVAVAAFLLLGLGLVGLGYGLWSLNQRPSPQSTP